MKKLKLPSKPTEIKVPYELDIYRLFQALDKKYENCFIFESLAEGDNSRYTIVGFDPEHIFRGNGKYFYFDNARHTVKNPYKTLQEIMPEPTISKGFAGGLVGYLSYEAAEFFEPSFKLKHQKGLTSSVLGFILTDLYSTKPQERQPTFYYQKNRLQGALRLVKKDTFIKNKLKMAYLGSSQTKKKHKQIVESVKHKIKNGIIFQCEVGIREKYHVTGSLSSLYDELRIINPSPYMYYLKFDKKTLLGASPELLFELKDGQMQTFPLAGTIHRGKNEEEDRHLAKKLLNDPKERAEHRMLVDLHRNDLGKVAKFGTVKIRKFLDVKKFSHVQHLSSEITGILASSEDMFSGLASCFPAGTLSGAPKIESMKIINQNEEEGRGPYGGAVGFFGFNSDCTFTIPIRSFFTSGTIGYTQTSGGIVHDSEVENEYRELLHKLRPMKIALAQFEQKNI